MTMTMTHLSCLQSQLLPSLPRLNPHLHRSLLQQQRHQSQPAQEERHHCSGMTMTMMTCLEGVRPSPHQLRHPNQRLKSAQHQKVAKDFSMMMTTMMTCCSVGEEVENLQRQARRSPFRLSA